VFTPVRQTASVGIDDTLVQGFRERGWALTPTLGPDEAAELVRWVDEVAAWPDDGEWMHHRELTDSGAALCRTENFVPFHPGLRALLTTGPMLDVASALLGEPAVLYKEKVNYKLVGGAGYSPHQDAPAYPFLDQHVSCMVAVDEATEANGCLEVVTGAHHELLPMDDKGCVHPDVVAELTWEPVPIPAGSTLWFHSRTPHRSGANRSDRPRRALYPTYNARSEGDLRDAYYAEKRSQFATGPSRVSLIGDFEGKML
jgi:ectoine hydroxylase-related dioxygenase (phytanoyl-CoA dioxygenase family)